MSDPAEKRRFARTEIDAAVQYVVAGNSTAHAGRLGNISAGGVLLWTTEKLRLGTTLYLQISAEDLGEVEVEVTATIVRLNPTQQEGQFGYGCRFDAIYGGPQAGAE